jgi:hypothetical protein
MIWSLLLRLAACFGAAYWLLGAAVLYAATEDRGPMAALRALRWPLDVVVEALRIGDR